jgi:hypothetical protein
VQLAVAYIDVMSAEMLDGVEMMQDLDDNEEQVTTDEDHPTQCACDEGFQCDLGWLAALLERMQCSRG